MSEAKKEGAATRQQEEKGRAATRQQGTKKEAVIYIGPTIRGVAATGTTYRNGLPDALRKEMERQPLIGSLLIPVGSLADAQKELAAPGSALHTVYGRVATK